MRGFSRAVFEERMRTPRSNPYQPLSRERPFGIVEPDDEHRFAGSVVRVQKSRTQGAHVGVVTRVLNRGKLIEVQAGFRGGIPAVFRYSGNEVLAIIDHVDNSFVARKAARRRRSVRSDAARPIARTAKHVLKRIAASGRECKMFTFENQFHGAPCWAGVAGALDQWLGSDIGRLRYKGNGKYVLSYHSNKWVEFQADAP